jgi:hypothetical protein
VLLGCVELDECGVKQVHTCGRKYIKPIECHCRKEPAQGTEPVPPNGDENQPPAGDAAPTRRRRGRRANS